MRSDDGKSGPKPLTDCSVDPQGRYGTAAAQRAPGENTAGPEVLNTSNSSAALARSRR